MLITENQLDEWVRGNAEEAQGVIAELVWRLVAASSPRPKDRRFPLGDSIGQPGPDGFLDVDFAFEPFVPKGASYWEIGTGLDAGRKATKDYRDLVAEVPVGIRHEAEFVFVTPLSGRRNWPHTWKPKAQARWLRDRRSHHDWREVHVIDGTKLVDWLQHFPSVEWWLAHKWGFLTGEIGTPEQRWDQLRTIGEPPPLPPKLFLANRDAACAQITSVFKDEAAQLRLDTRYPDQVVDFVSAYVADLEGESRVDAVGRCVVVSTPAAWRQVTAQRARHIIIADFDIDQAGTTGTLLLETARRGGHAVIYRGMPGGIPHPNRVTVSSPHTHQVESALENAGYPRERARTLAQKSGGNLGSLLRCLQNLSLIPEWGENSYAADLAVAAMLGSWSEASEADRSIAENVSGNSYGEWIGRMRDVVLRPGTPLVHREGIWKFVSRYEGWHVLGRRLFDQHLDRLQSAAVSVLREADPIFKLPAGERHVAVVRGKVFQHSAVLRAGLAEGLALVGSYPAALTSCSFSKADTAVRLAIREILTDASWELWASLDDVLPLLAEASPGEFLDAVDRALGADPCPFDQVFAQEGVGILGATYMSGLLWGLETLAWDPQYLIQVVRILGALAARDPGGQWANRPDHTLAVIFLPWFPQTCAAIATRRAAVEMLIKEHPEVGWKLLQAILPNALQHSSGSRRPVWREIIPHDWAEGGASGEYMEQIRLYAQLAVDAAKSDRTKLAQLIERLGELPSPADGQLLDWIGSDEFFSAHKDNTGELWSELLGLIAKHNRFAGAPWAARPDQIARIALAAQCIKPSLPEQRHKRLFGQLDVDLYGDGDTYEEQQKDLDERRAKAVTEIAAIGGVEAVVRFAESVDSPWRVGGTLGYVAGAEADASILPDLLDVEPQAVAQFTAGFTTSRFRRGGWEWVDQTMAPHWSPDAIGLFLSYLPFTQETWTRAARLISGAEAAYWRRTGANPYEADGDLSTAVEQLVGHGRPRAAIRCLSRSVAQKQSVDTSLAVRALMTAPASPELRNQMDPYDAIAVIKALQDEPSVPRDDIQGVEWVYIQILDGHRGFAPRHLDRRLADDPKFFCEMIQLIFRPKKGARPPEEATEQRKLRAANGYRLLSRWTTLPGSQEAERLDGAALSAWFQAVKIECIATGHLEAAMTTVGRMLTHAPADPDGLWTHRSVATLLDEKDANGLREGFTIGLFNSRGVHWSTGGTEERAFAVNYRARAAETELAGFHRLAQALRDLAESYDHDAAREVSRELSDEWG